MRSGARRRRERGRGSGGASSPRRVPRQLGADRRAGVLPARADARVDGADVRQHAAAAAFDASGRRPGARRAPRSRRRRLARPAPGRRGCTCTTMWRALSSTRVHRFLRHARDALRPRRQLVAHHLLRDAGRAPAPASAPCRTPAHRAARRTAAAAAPNCAAFCCSTLRLKFSERHQAVAVAVLVAGLARAPCSCACCSALSGAAAARGGAAEARRASSSRSPAAPRAG